MRDSFSTYHPMVNFIYFAFVLLFSMFFMNPISLIISLVTGLTYAIYLNGKKAVRFSLLYLLPMMILAAIINLAFNHEGVTILTYLPSGNPLTLESIIYGLASAMMLASVITWFSCYSAVMTSDKFVYLFGKIIPALSLVLSMTLRFVPKFKNQLNIVSESQKCIGRDVSTGSLLERMKKGITILSIMTSWALENAIETADSMKSRGYGLPNRSAFSIYTFDERDKMALSWILFCGIYILSGYFANAFYFAYFPMIKIKDITAFSVSFKLIYFALCITPVILNKKEDFKWKKLLNHK